MSEENSVFKKLEGLKLKDEGGGTKHNEGGDIKASLEAAKEAVKRAQKTTLEVAAATSAGQNNDNDGDEAVDTGYKESTVAKKSLNDILDHDNEDESLRKYKESLLGAAASGGATGDASDPRRFYVTELRIMFDPSEGQQDLVFELETPEKIAQLKKNGVTMKEGAKFKYKITFKVQHDIVAGMKFKNKVKKLMFSEKEELVIGSYPPAAEPHVFEFPRFNYSEAPSGMMYRGTYTVVNSFVDSDGTEHQKFDYELKIRSSW